MQAVKIYSFLFLVVILYSCKKDSSNGIPINTYNGKTKLVFNPSVTYGSMTDQEGNIYKTITIGNQTWMAENLRTSKFNDSTRIQTTTSSYDPTNNTNPFYFSYRNTASIDTIATFGLLYNWYAVNTGKLAPKGWRIPTISDWEVLINYLGGISQAGPKLKQAGNVNWAHDNADATNSSGFTAIAGGYRDEASGEAMGSHGFYWSSSTNSNDLQNAYSVGFLSYQTQPDFQLLRKGNGFSVRCIKE